VGLHQLSDREPHLRLPDQGDDDARRQKLWLQVCPLRQVSAAAHEGNFFYSDTLVRRCNETTAGVHTFYGKSE
jgi:hypothetical protein